VFDLSVTNNRKSVIFGNEIPHVTDENRHQWNADFAKLINLPVSLSIFTAFSAAFKPVTVLNNVPNPRTQMLNGELEGKSTNVINQECEKILKTISFSKADQEAVEMATRDQSAGSEWKSNELVGLQEQRRYDLTILKCIIAYDAPPLKVSKIKFLFT
jgi:hypothetical protein